VLLCLGVEASNSGWEILLLGIICGAPEKQTAADNARTARFEKAPRFSIIDSENFPCFWIVPGVVAGNVVGEESYRQLSFRTVNASYFSKEVLLNSGLVRALPRCSDNVPLIEIRSEEQAALSLRHWGHSQPGDARRWKREEVTRSRVLRRPTKDRSVALRNCVVPIMKAFA